MFLSLNLFLSQVIAHDVSTDPNLTPAPDAMPTATAISTWPDVRYSAREPKILATAMRWLSRGWWDKSTGTFRP
jgi:hypothetical protein